LNHNKSNVTLVLAIGLYINKIEPYGLTMSDKLINAVKQYQKKYNLEVDGIAGIGTFKSLATIK
jgi:murein L,D-transpeptidase YcbB/YkuD